MLRVFPQRLKPICSPRSMSELKLRPRRSNPLPQAVDAAQEGTLREETKIGSGIVAGWLMMRA
jgi:hypothetical protein